MSLSRLFGLALVVLALASLAHAQWIDLNVDNPCQTRYLTATNGETTDRNTWWSYFDNGAAADQPTIANTQRLAQRFNVDAQDWEVSSFTVAVFILSSGTIPATISSGFFDFYDPSSTDATLPVSTAFSTFKRFNTSCSGNSLFYTGVGFPAYTGSYDPYIYRCNLTTHITLPANTTKFFSVVIGELNNLYRMLAFTTPTTPSSTVAAYRGSSMSSSDGVDKRPFILNGSPAPLGVWTTDTGTGYAQTTRQLCVGLQGIKGPGTTSTTTGSSSTTGGGCGARRDWLEARHQELEQQLAERDNERSSMHCAQSQMVVSVAVALSVALLVNAVVCVVFCRTPPRRVEELE